MIAAYFYTAGQNMLEYLIITENRPYLINKRKQFLYNISFHSLISLITWSFPHIPVTGQFLYSLLEI